ncbi:MAG: M48 family metallopeptidase [Halocynthiibacter sp.]
MAVTHKITSGRYYPPRQSRSTPAVLSKITSTEVVLIIDEDGVSHRHHLDGAQFDAPLGNLTRKVTFPDGAMFEPDDEAAMTALFPDTGWSRLHQFEAFTPRLIAVVFAVLTAGWLIWRFGLDILVAGAVMATPTSLTSAIDVSTLQTADLAVLDETTLTTSEQRKLQSVFDDLVRALPQSERDSHHFTLLFRDGETIGPNALALPGGTVIVTDQLVRGFPDPNIHAAVIGHELSHVTEEHGLRQMYRALSTALLIALIIGDTGPIIEEMILEGNALLSLTYSRKHETDADTIGVGLTKRAGYDPTALITFFEKLEDEYGSGGMEWTSTHPSNDHRIEDIKKTIDALN